MSRSPRVRRFALVLCGCLLAVQVAGARAAAPGTLAQLTGVAGCVSDDGRASRTRGAPPGGPCADGVGLGQPVALAISGDGRHVYAASPPGDAVTAFAHDPGSGGLVQLPGADGCVAGGGLGGACAPGRRLAGAGALALSPDGRSLYVAASSESGAAPGLAVLGRDPATGTLAQPAGAAGCVADVAATEPDAEGCTAGRALLLPASVAVSPDGATVYVASSGSDGVAVFVRDPVGGALAQSAGADGCVTEDGRAAPPEDGRPDTAGACAAGAGLGSAAAVAVSGDGRSVYVAGPAAGATDDAPGGAIAVFRRDPATGALVQLPGPAGCVGAASAGCAPVSGLAGVRELALSPDGRDVYAGGGEAGDVRHLRRDPLTGALTPAPEPPVGRFATRVAGLAVTSDGRDVLLSTPDADGAIVGTYRRDPATGALGERLEDEACWGLEPAPGCTVGRALEGAGALVASADGRSVYVAAQNDAAIASFARELPDVTAPVLGALAVTPRRLAPERFGATVLTSGGAVVGYEVSEPATVRFALVRLGRDRPAAPLAGVLIDQATAGANRVRFSGRWRGAALAPGAYLLVADPFDAAGNRGARVAATLRIVSGRRAAARHRSARRATSPRRRRHRTRRAARPRRAAAAAPGATPHRRARVR